jgi:ABC-type transporter MlaC component
MIQSRLRPLQCCLALLAGLTTLLLSGVSVPSSHADAVVDPAVPVMQLRAGYLQLARKGWPPALSDVAALIERAFDLGRITRAVLGRHAAAASPEQQARLERALGLRMARESLRLHLENLEGDFAVIERRPIGEAEWLVITRAELRGSAADPARPEPVVIRWRVRADARGLRIIDVFRDGVSAVATQRDDFDAALRRRDLDAVISELERRALLPADAR